MKKGLFLIMILIIGGLFLTSGLLKAASFPSVIIINGKNYKRNIMGPVKFKHTKHLVYGLSCKECHHIYKDGKNVWKIGDPVKKCDECHNPNKSQVKIVKLETAFHKKCRGCHERVDKKYGYNAPYRKCFVCHAKK